MRRALPAAVALAISATVLPAAFSPSSAAPAAPTVVVPANVALKSAVGTAKKQVKTPYVMGASAYGTRVKGGDVPAGSSETGYAVMGCNRFANKSRSNAVAEIEVPVLGTIDGVKSQLRTVKSGSKISSIGTHSIASISLFESELGSLSIKGIKSVSTAFHQGKKFGATVNNQIAQIVLTPPGGVPPVNLGIPAPGVPIEVPGLLRISLGAKHIDKGADFATAGGSVLRIEVIPTSTTVVVGSTRATIALGRTRGLFNGYGAGIQARLLDPVADAGRTAYQPIPCTGTDNKNVIKNLASADLDPLATAGVTAGGVNAGRVGKGAKAKAVGTVSNIVLGGGALEIGVATGVADVQRLPSGKLKVSTKGTHIGAITAGGETYDLDALGQLEIPGVAKLQGNVKQRFSNGIKVIGLRVTLLDGTLAVVDLGVAMAKIRPTKKR